jgi:hypothetical protein
VPDAGPARVEDGEPGPFLAVPVQGLVDALFRRPFCPAAEGVMRQRGTSAGYLSVTVKLLLWSLGLDVTAMAWPPVSTSR